MNKKWKYRISKNLILAIVITFSFLTTNVNGIINANELPANVNEQISENDMTNRNLNQGRASNSGRFEIGQFVFSGADRDNGGNEGFTANNRVNFLRQNIFQIGYQNIAGKRQARMATSPQGFKLDRSFEVIVSVNMKRYPHHGFFFALHQNPSYQVTNTGGSLGIYQDTGFGESRKPGLGNAFVMEIDGWKDNAHGDNMNGINKEHFEILETGPDGKYGYMNGTGPWGTSKKVKVASGSELFAGDDPQVDRIYFKFKWEPKPYVGKQGLYSINFLKLNERNEFVDDPSLTAYNSVNQNSDLLNRMYANSGYAWISLGGSIEYTGTPMEIGLHSIRYTDLEPGMNTKFYDESGQIELNTVYPGQTITVLHKLYNIRNIKYDVRDGLNLYYLYLQFLSEDELKGSLGAQNNISVYDVKSGRNRNGLSPAGAFDTNNSLKVEFPSSSQGFYVQYKMKVPTRLNADKYYKQKTYLHIHSEIGEDGYKAYEMVKNEELRLAPKISSTRQTANGDTKERHETYKYTNANVTKDAVIQEIWNNIRITTTDDTNVLIRTEATETAGSYIRYQYYLNGTAVNKGQINNQLTPGNALTLAIEVKDKKNSNLKSYYYRTLVFADSFKLSNDGNYVIYGNHLGEISETKLSTLNHVGFRDEMKTRGKVKAIKRNYVINQLSNFSNSNVDVKAVTMTNGYVDLSATDRFIVTLQAKENNVMAETQVNLKITSNTSSVDNGKNPLDGQTGYIIIPSNIELVDNSSTRKAIGSGRVFAAGYNTGKKYHVWAQPTVVLTSPEMSGTRIDVKTEAVGSPGTNPTPGNGLIYLGSIDNTNNQKKQLNLRLVADSSKHKDIRFNGSLVFTFAKY